MKTSLDHLPQGKQDEICEIIKIIIKTKLSFKPEFIILFGSYARGDWVEDIYQDDKGTTFEYKSDFDLLIVVETPEQVHFKTSWRKMRNSILSQSHIKTPVSIIEEDIESLNKALSKGQYFYSDIKKEGITLYDSGRFQLADARELHPNERHQTAQMHFNHWFEKAMDFKAHLDLDLERQKYNMCALDLHQMAECLLSTILLVFTDYRPKTHDLEVLYSLAASQIADIRTVFPKSNDNAANRFELLRKAYVDVRYSQTFQIKKNDLNWLISRVEKLKFMTKTRCLKKISSFEV